LVTLELCQRYWSCSEALNAIDDVVQVFATLSSSLRDSFYIPSKADPEKWRIFQGKIAAFCLYECYINVSIFYG
jgi:hypothetical protein